MDGENVVSRWIATLTFKVLKLGRYAHVNRKHDLLVPFVYRHLLHLTNTTIPRLLEYQLHRVVILIFSPNHMSCH